MSVSDDYLPEPTLTLDVIIDDAYAGRREARVKMAGQPAADLPLLAGMAHSEFMWLSAQGPYIVGSNVNPDTATSRGVRWTRIGYG